MRILYIIDHFETNYPRDQNYIIRYMSERGHHVTVATSSDKAFEKFDKAYFPKMAIIRAPSILRVKKAKIFISLSIINESLVKTHDLIHTFTFFTFSPLMGVIGRANASVIRSEIGPHPSGENFRKAHRHIYRFLLSLIKKSYTVITAYNQIEAESLKLVGVPESKIIILPPMIDFSKFSSFLKEELHKPVTIGTIARLSPSKGIHNLIPIMKKVLKVISPHKLEFVLAGRIDNKPYGISVLRELRKLFGNRFHYLGELASPYHFYEKIDVMIVPSLIETGAITVLEAMAAGKIVLANNIYPINTYIKDSYSGFLYNGLEEATEKLVFILENLKSSKPIMTKASQTARTYDYKNICASLETKYYELLTGKSA